MRMSNLFSQTLRDTPAEVEVRSHQLLLRAGFIRQVAAGVFAFLPLGRMTLRKIETILREEMEAIGGQEVLMPVVLPADILKETGRWDKFDTELGRFKDRTGREMALAMTHEEAVADLIRKEIRSYRQLPRLIYHIQTKWRDDPRPRAGLIRTREFTMKDGYSLDADQAGLERQYAQNYQAYFNIFQRCGLPVIAVKADVGMMGGDQAHEFMYLTPIGEDTLLLCPECGYAANRQIARFRKPDAEREELLPMIPVETPECKTIEELATFLGVPKAKTAKAVFLMADTGKEYAPEKGNENLQFIFAVVRGDMEVNETKLANAVNARSLRPATEDEIRRVGAEPGYASPAGLSKDGGMLVVVDEAVRDSPNLVSGANREGYHLRNVNYGRDYQADIVTDIASAGEGDACPDCGAKMHAVRGVEVGNIFQLGTWYSEAMGCTFQDAEGQERPVVMGSYGIGLGRLLACIAEQHNDEHGLAWPASVAPYDVHLVLLSGKGKDAEAIAMAERLYEEIQAVGFEVLYDDREESPGVKFNDADLIGAPIRLTVSPRAMQAGGVEFKRRDQEGKEMIPTENLLERIESTLEEMKRSVLSQTNNGPQSG